MTHRIPSFTLTLLTALSLQAAGDDAGAQRTAPPLPFHTIEGYGGGAITPIAYLVNAPEKGETFGRPAAAFSYVSLGQKSLQTYTLTENIKGRLELGFSAGRLDLGNLPAEIRNATGVDVQHQDTWLKTFNLRVLALPENSFGLSLPALTFGIHYKINDSIDDINKRLGNALTNLGYQKDSGTEFTQTLSKTFPLPGGRPLILTVGARESQAANLGFLGFTDTYKTTLEGNLVFLPTSWLLIAYEYRDKPDALKQLPGLIEREGHWQALDLSWIISSRATLVAGIGKFGYLANAKADSAWWLQTKFEF